MTNNERTQEDMQRECDKHNKTLVPEHKGYVREDGPSRQYKAEIRGGRVVYVEQ